MPGRSANLAPSPRLAGPRRLDRLRSWWVRRGPVAKTLLAILGVFVLVNVVYWAWFVGVLVYVAFHGPSAA